ncbi:MAG: type IV pilus modification PilV family protein [Campylobacterota bacterium]
MKQALSLIEVLVSVVVITIAIGALLKTNNQSFKAVENLKKQNNQQTALNVFSIVAISNPKDTKYYLSDLVKGLDIEKLDREFKDIKYEIDVEKLRQEEFNPGMGFSLTLNPQKIVIYNDKFQKEFVIPSELSLK